jgi:hypothetical protein
MSEEEVHSLINCVSSVVSTRPKSKGWYCNNYLVCVDCAYRLFENVLSRLQVAIRPGTQLAALQSTVQSQDAESVPGQDELRQLSAFSDLVGVAKRRAPNWLAAAGVPMLRPYHTHDVYGQHMATDWQLVYAVLGLFEANSALPELPQWPLVTNEGWSVYDATDHGLDRMARQQLRYPSELLWQATTLPVFGHLLKLQAGVRVHAYNLPKKKKDDQGDTQ